MQLSEYLNISKEITGKQLSEFLDFNIVKHSAHKGAIGDAFEEQVFNKKIDNKSEADLDFFIDEYHPELLDYFNTDVKIELKVTPAKQNKNGEYRSKERLVLSMIDYMEQHPDNFSDSHVYSKIKLMLIIYYLYDKNLSIQEYTLLTSFFVNLDNHDLSILERDYQVIISKIRNGEAHLLSGSDTFYLEACTKAANSSVTRKQPYSDIPAKPRAFALKNAYMSNLLNSALSEKLTPLHNERNDLEYIDKKLQPLIGMTLNEIIKQQNMSFDKEPKQLKSMVIRKVLNVTKNDMSDLSLFKNADLGFKCVSAFPDGKKKEDINFNAKIRADIVNTEWEDSDLHDVVNKVYFYCVFIHDRKDTKKSPIFAGYTFKGFTDDEIIEAQEVWLDVKESISNSEGDVPILPKASDGTLFFVRTKGINAEKSTKPLTGEIKLPTRQWWLQTTVLNTEIIQPILDQFKKM
ncbi:MutH/Sau3AI family endonuclease [Mollicutes bacterium LVI A0078]|nr:MutH/Sau3AI family endonuclease [Mollicutes bacterium LVI A0075]WOO90179.1 MutH/Sau3AI family endonuclease [Mollicutes bacterium LVI A0078]